MKYRVYFIGLVILLLSAIMHPALANEGKLPEPKLIETYKEDITGDGQNETIQLYGTLFSQDGAFYKDIWAIITFPDKKEQKITYGGGYEPSLQFFDINHDNVNDIFFQSATGGSGGLYSHQLNTIKQNKFTEIPLPVQDHIKGSFQENFKVSIQISHDREPEIINVDDRSSEYIRLGIYNKRGKLLQNTSVMIDPIAFYEPLFISKSKGFGLKSYQQISGAYHADRLGAIETLWYCENDDWIILQTKWVPAD